MYEERRAFPTKWIILASILIVLVVGIPIYINYKNNQDKRAYDDVIARIEAAAVAYGEDEVERLRVLEKTCLTLDLLMKEGFLKSDSKNELVIYNPLTKKKMAGLVELWIESQTGRKKEKIDSEYLFDKACDVNYQDKVKLVITNQNTHSFSAKIESTVDIGLNSYQYKIDGADYFKHDVNEYKFDELIAGNHKVYVKATDFLGLVYERQAEVTIGAVSSPELVYNEGEKSIVVECPNQDDEDIVCTYTTNNETWITVDENTKKHVFKENGRIIARATDGFNTSEEVSKEVIFPPACVDTTWSECGGCVACGGPCTGVQTSNCGNTRSCKVEGNCNGITPTTYIVTVNAVNGTTENSTVEVISGYSKVMTVTPLNGYKFNSVTCNVGTASYNENTSKLTIDTVKSSRVCTVNFRKIVVEPKVYTVSFYDLNGNIITTKKIDDGDKVSAITAPNVQGYTFVSWTRNGVTYDFNTPVKSNISLTANYVGVKYIITFNSAGGSSLASQYIPAGGKVYEPNNPYRAAYHFTYWSESGSVYDFNRTVNRNITLVANWAPLTSKTMIFNGSMITQTITLSNFTGIHEVTSNCPSNFTYKMNGNSITATLNNAESCSISVLYY